MKRILSFLLFAAFLMPWSAQAQKALPYNYGFEDNDLTVDGWTTSNTSGLNADEFGIHTSAAKTGDYGFRFSSYDESGANTQCLISPELVAPNGLVAQFYYKNSRSNYAETFKVGYSTTTTDLESFTWGEDISATGGSWTLSEEFNFPAGTKYVALYYSSNYQYRLFVDDVAFMAPPTCPAPTISEELTLTSEGATITWTAGGSETSWQYVCLAAGADLSWDDAITTTTPSVTLTGKTANTAYDFYVRAYCGQDDQSAERKVSFRTACGIEAIPYTNDFEEETSSAVPSCWTRPEGQSYPYVYNSTYSSYEGSKCLYFNGGSSYSEQFIVLPKLANAINTLAIQFYYKASVTGWSTYGVPQIGYVTNRDDMTTFVALDTLDQQSDYTLYELNLDAAPANAAYIALRYGDGSSSGSFYVDNLTVKAIPNCKKPATLNISDITTTGATFTWTAGGSETNFEYVVMAAGTDVDWTNAVAVNQLTATLTTLTANTAYDFYVRAACGGTEKSDCRMVSFRTACDVYELPFEENFNSLTSGIPSCWDNTEGTTTDASYRWNYYATGNDGACVRFNSYNNSSNKTNILATPAIHLTADAQLTFMWKNPTGGAGMVLISANGGDRDTLMTELTGISAWTEKTIDLSAYTGQTVNIYFHGTSNYGNGDAYLYLDNVKVAEIPNCLKPTSLTASDVTANGATLKWVAGGTETAWQICVNGDEENLIDAYDSTYVLTNLTPATAYSVKVRANCGDSQSDWSNVINFNTPAIAEVVGDNWSDDFEGESCSWELINGTIANAWVCGTAVNNGGTHSLYVSNDGGTTHAYTNNVETMVYAAKLLNFADGKYQFSYDWLANGESTYDYLRVALVPASVTLTAGSSIVSGMTATALPSGWIALDGGNKLNLVTTWQNKVVAINVTAGNYYLVLAWRDDTSGGTNPPAAVDNMSITRMACSYDVAGLAADSIAADAATITWTHGEATQWQVAYGLNSNFEGATDSIVNDSTITLTGLTANTAYYVKARVYCGGTDFGAWSNAISFRTNCSAYAAATYTEGFEEGDGFYCWTVGNAQSTSSTYIPSTGTTYKRTGEKGLHIYAYKYNPSYSYYTPVNADSAYAILPVMDYGTPGLAGHTLSFYAKSSDAGNAYYKHILVGVVSDPADISTFELIQDVEITAAYGDTPYEVVLSSYTGTGSRLALLAVVDPASTAEYRYGNIYVDDIVIVRTPTCQPLAKIEATEIGRRNITVTLTPKTGLELASTYELVYDTIALDDDSLAVVDKTMVIDTNKFEITGLDRETTYYIYVRANCGEGDLSAWVSTTATTRGLNYTDEIIVADGTATNSYLPIYGSYTDTEGTKMQMIYPANLLTGLSGITINSLHYFANGTNSNWTDAVFEVRMMQTETATMGSDFVATDAATLVYTGTVTVNPTDGMLITLATPFTYTEGNLLIEFLVTTESGYKSVPFYGITTTENQSRYFGYSASNAMFLPKVGFGYSVNLEACPAVTDLKVELVGDGTSEARISWTTADADYLSSYDLYLSETEVDDFTGITPTVTDVAPTATSYLFSNLTAEASYYFYIRANCQAEGHQDEGSSDWIGVDTTMNANCAAPKELTTELIGLNAVKASWEKAYPEQDVLEFRYILSTEELDAAGLAAETPVDADTNAIELNDLDYNQTYYLYVATACSATSTSDYIHTSFTTFAECAPVENLTVARFEHNRVVLTWTKNEFGTETEYEVGIVGDETNAQRVAGLTTMLIGLEPETDYTAYVKALCGEESASVITTVPFTTASMPGACVTIGSGTTTTSYGPIYSYYNRPAYTQQLYVLNDASAGTITSIALEHKGNSYNGDMTVTNYTIYMANTSATSLASGWITEGLTEVFTGTTTFPHGTNGNWVTIDLTTPFVWDGTSNIVVAVYTPTVYTLTAGTYDSYFYGTSASGAGRYYAESSGVTLEDNLVPSAAGTTFSTIANIQFCFEPKACPDVTAMTISDITPTTAVATWEPMGQETSWKIAYTTEVVDNPALLSTTVDEMRYEMNGLDVDQDYWFYVQPVCEGADSWRVATFRTIATCFPPTALRADSIKAHTALVCWQDTINEAGNYTVAYGPAAEFDEGDFSTVNVMGDTCVLLIGLIPETNYKFKVCANCSPDTSSRYSTVATFRTDISCYAPTALVASNITSTSAVITWTDLHDAAAYRVYYGEAATFDLEDEDTYFTLDVETGTTATLNDLNSYTQYQVVVKSICSDEDESAYSTDLTFKTSATVPFVPVFTSTTPFPSDWKRYDGLFNTDTILTSALTTSSKWGLVSATTAINSIHFKANIYTSSWGGSTMGWVITPTIDLSTVAEGSELILSFDAALNKYSETTTDPDSNDTDDKFAVIISRDGGLTWTKTDMTLWQNVEGADYRYSDIPKTGHTYSIDMTQYAGMNIAIAFYGESTVSGDDNDLHFGNINLIQQVHYTDSVCQYLNFENHGFEEASSEVAGTFHFEGLKDQVYTIFDLTVNEGTDPASNFVDIESAYVGDHFDFPFLSFTVAAGDDGWYDNSEAGTTTVHGCPISFAAIIHEILTAEIFPTEYQTLAEGDTINWRGHKITVVGEYADTVRTVHGGVMEIHSLTVSESIPMTIYSATVCQYGEFDNHGFEEASSDSVGDFEYHSDSVIFLLTVNPISVEEYDRYLYPGDHYSDANFEEFVATIDTSYILVGTNVKDCDSIIIMHVIINPVDTIRETFEMPENDTIWHGITITEPGMYYYTEPSFLGGDSIRYILTVTAPVTPVEGRTFELVTEQLSDWSGNYLIVFADNKAHATVSGGKKKDLVATSGELTITSDNKITTADSCFVTIEAMGNDGYSILLPNGMYLNEPSDNSVDESANAQAMTLTYNETKAGVEISGGNRILCHNSTNGNFYRMYSAVGSHALPRLFKEVSGEGPGTAIETIDTANEAVKVILNGNLYIIRDNQWYDATGRLTSDPRK